MTTCDNWGLILVLLVPVPKKHGAKQQEFHRAVDRPALLQQGIIETFDVKVCQTTLHTSENGLSRNRTGIQ